MKHARKIFSTLFFYLPSPLGGSGVWTQGFALIGKCTATFWPMPLTPTPSLLAVVMFWIGSCVCLGQPGPWSSYYWFPTLAGMTDTCHCSQLFIGWGGRSQIFFAWTGLKLWSSWSLPPKWLGLQAWATKSSQGNCHGRIYFLFLFLRQGPASPGWPWTSWCSYLSLLSA
jgi:hypothetical protein